MEKIIITPYDFTRVSEIALDHSLIMGKVIKAKVSVLHIIDNKSQVAEAKQKLKVLKEWVRTERGEEIDTIVRIGNIFEDVDKVTAEIGADLIIMGSHGALGFHFHSGTRALKMVMESSVPFIVTQERAIRNHGYRNLVVPMDLHKDTKQKLTSVGNMAKYFNSKVILVSPNTTDTFLKNQLAGNITFATEYLKGRGIDYEVEILETKDPFIKGMLKYAASIEADMICIVNSNEYGFFSSLFSNHEETQVITNDAQIPVLCVNAVSVVAPDVNY